jgi:hypothetical protein
MYGLRGALKIKVEGNASFPHEGRVAHISLVFREMWDSTDVDR